MVFSSYTKTEAVKTHGFLTIYRLVWVAHCYFSAQFSVCCQSRKPYGFSYVVRVWSEQGQNMERISSAPTLIKSHLVSWEYAFLRSGLHVLRPRLGVRRCEHSTGLIEKPLIAHASRHQIFFPPTLLVAIEDRRLKPVAYLTQWLKLHTQQKTVLLEVWRPQERLLQSNSLRARKIHVRQ